MSSAIASRSGLGHPTCIATRAGRLQRRIHEERGDHAPLVAIGKEHCTLESVPIGTSVRVIRVLGERAFRRRLMEMGMVPGTRVTMTNVAPLRDPIEIEVRDARLSIRRREAANVVVEL